MNLWLRSFPKLAAICSAIGLAVGLGVAFAIPAEYESNAVVVFEDRSAPGSPAHLSPIDRFFAASGQLQSRTGLATLIQSPRLNLYEEERKQEPMEDVVDRMRQRDLRTEILTTGDHAATVRIRFRYTDRLKAQSAVQAMLTTLQQEDKRALAGSMSAASVDEVTGLEQRIAELEKRAGIKGSPISSATSLTGRVNIAVFDAPSLAETPISPNRLLIALAGLGAGFLFAAIFSIFRRPTKLPAPTPAVTA